MAIKEKDIVNMFMTNQWLYDKTFWSLLKFIAWDDEVQELTHLLKNAWFSDVDEVIGRKLDRKNLKEMTKILFNYNEKNEWNPTT
jgi:uncharacterized membrane protein YheB (UPF0754 family)